MIRFPLLVTAIFTSLGACSNVVFADPDISIVRSVIGADKSQVTVAGNTRLVVVASVLNGLNNCKRPADGVTVGPYLRLPEADATKQPLIITVCSSGSFDGGGATAYIGVTPKAPFDIVTAIATELRECGFTDVRLLSDESIRNDILPLVGKRDQKSETADPR